MFLVLALAWALLIFRLTGGEGIKGSGGFGWQYLYNGSHAFLFAVQGILLGLGIQAGSARRRLIALLLCSGYGAFSEWYQGFLPNRHPDPMDWLSDTAGAAFGLVLLGVMAGMDASGRRRAVFLALGLAVLCLASAYLATVT